MESLTRLQELTGLPRSVLQVLRIRRPYGVCRLHKAYM